MSISLFAHSTAFIVLLNSVEISVNLLTKSSWLSFSSFTTKPFSSTFTFLVSSGLNLNSKSSPSVLLISWPWSFCISGLFIIVVIKHSFILSSDISFDIIKTFFLWTNAVYAAKFIVNLLLPELEGIANAIVSPFLNPLNTPERIGNGNSNPFVKVLSPISKKLVKSLFKTACLNFPVTVTWFTALSTSSTDIDLYKT